jgi:1,4-alpha-glucan branching enzyme
MKAMGVQNSGRSGKRAPLLLPGKPRARKNQKSRLSRRTLAIQIKAGGDSPALQQCSYSPVAFTLIAPDAKHVYLAGSFNNWDTHCTPLSRGINGEWSGYLPLKPGHYEYRFVVDGVWKDDPDASASVPNPFGSTNSVLFVRKEQAQ